MRTQSVVTTRKEARQRVHVKEPHATTQRRELLKGLKQRTKTRGATCNVRFGADPARLDRDASIVIFEKWDGIFQSVPYNGRSSDDYMTSNSALPRG